MAQGKKQDYSQTLNLPKTDFPMKADLIRKEPKILTQWEEMNLYSQMRSVRSGGKKYILHDGPPYANGHIHIGTALNKILKDFVVRSKALSGFDSPLIPGWDCHGLPIEHQVLKELGPRRHDMTQQEIRKKCREYAERFINIQRDEFKRLGGVADWEHPYLTMAYDYESDIVREFGKVVEAGGVYRANKPVLWCSHDETALAEAEVEYEEHTSPSVFVRFPVSNPQDLFRLDPEGVTSVVIWTTTPWTLVANQAISMHPRKTYRLVKTPIGNLILAHDLVESCMKAFRIPEGEYQVEREGFTGSQFVIPRQVVCRHPWLDLSVPVVTGDHVTVEQGTGCVHTAPGHGQEDYEVGLRYGLEPYAPVDHQGRFTEDVQNFGGMKVLEANPAIISKLRDEDMLIHEEVIRHAYPHCWRCKNPVIFRATKQWFISMDKNQLRRRALTQVDRTRWIPSWGHDRIYGMVENRPDWCISRQRIWGVPIVAFTCEDCDGVVLDSEVVHHVAEIIRAEGTDAWFSKTARELLPSGKRCQDCGSKHFQKERDILDVWFESGVSHAAVLKTRPELDWPADLYLEGSDQHRGWFHSTLLVGLQTDGRPPYSAVLTHGFVVDGRGKKMSKSAGNVIAPQEIIKQYGAEILRLWVAATDFREDIRISREIISHLVEAYRKIRNTCRFLLGNLYDYNGDSNPLAHLELKEIDRFMLHRLQKLIGRVRRAYDEFEFHAVFHSLNQFCAVDLSAFYLDVVKDRLYSEKSDSSTRRAVQGVLDQCLVDLVCLMAPVLSFTAEEIWAHIPPLARPHKLRETASIHLATFPEVRPLWLNDSLASRWEKLIAIREEVSRLVEKVRVQRRIGASQDSQVSLYARDSLYGFLSEYQLDLADLFIVSEVNVFPWKDSLPTEVTVGQEIKELGVLVEPAKGQKCARCWRFRSDLGMDSGHSALCGRCATAVRSQAGTQSC